MNYRRYTERMNWTWKMKKRRTRSWTSNCRLAKPNAPKKRGSQHPEVSGWRHAVYLQQSSKAQEARNHVRGRQPRRAMLYSAPACGVGGGEQRNKDLNKLLHIFPQTSRGGQIQAAEELVSKAAVVSHPPMKPGDLHRLTFTPQAVVAFASQCRLRRVPRISSNHLADPQRSAGQRTHPLPFRLSGA